MKRLLLILTLFILISCSNEKIIHLDLNTQGPHNSTNTRDVAYLLSKQNEVSTIPPPFHADHCDCVVQKQKHTPLNFIRQTQTI